MWSHGFRTGMLFTSDESCAFAAASHVAAAAPKRDKNRMAKCQMYKAKQTAPCGPPRKIGRIAICSISGAKGRCFRVIFGGNLELRKSSNSSNNPHDVHINFCITNILISNSPITSQNHVFPRRFIRSYWRQPDSGHQATSRTRSRRRQCKTARRGIAALRFSRSSPTHTDSTAAPETQRTLLRALHPQTRFFAVIGRVHLLFSVHGKVHVRLERRLQAIHQPHTERGRFRRPHDVKPPKFHEQTRPITRRKEKKGKEGPIV